MYNTQEYNKGVFTGIAATTLATIATIAGVMAMGVGVPLPIITLAVGMIFALGFAYTKSRDKRKR